MRLKMDKKDYEKDPAIKARKLLRKDKTGFTVNESFIVLGAMHRMKLDEATIQQIFDDIKTYPYYDALAMWFDTPGFMNIPELKKLCKILLELIRKKEKSLIQTDRMLRKDLRELIRMKSLSKNSVKLLERSLTWTEAAWRYFNPDRDEDEIIQILWSRLLHARLP
jgi:hypothetical protein